jgi:hypothetical protein
VLDALSEIAFNPDMLVSRLDKERKAVLAEAQMMNTIEYRVDCQLLQYLHEENLLGYRFPIGKTDQVLVWGSCGRRPVCAHLPSSCVVMVADQLLTGKRRL